MEMTVQQLRADDTPGIDEFVQVEKMPEVDLEQLQKNVIYPDTAKKGNIQGTVLVKALIDTEGQVIKTVVQHSDSELLSDAAETAVKITPFSPAEQKGKKIKCWVTIPIKFKLK